MHPLTCPCLPEPGPSRSLRLSFSLFPPTPLLLPSSHSTTVSMFSFRRAHYYLNPTQASTSVIPSPSPLFHPHPSLSLHSLYPSTSTPFRVHRFLFLALPRRGRPALAPSSPPTLPLSFAYHLLDKPTVLSASQSLSDLAPSLCNLPYPLPRLGAWHKTRTVQPYEPNPPHPSTLPFLPSCFPALLCLRTLQ